MAQGLVNSSIVTTTTGLPIHVEIVNIALMYWPLIMAGYPRLGPAFDSATEEIAATFPSLNVTQVYLKDSSTEGTFDDWLTYYNPEKTLAEYFFAAEKSGRTPPNITIFLMTGVVAENSLPTAQVSAELDTLLMTIVLCPVAEGIWPTWRTVTVLPIMTISRFYQVMLERFHWSHFTLIWDTTANNFFTMFADAAHNYLAKNSKSQMMYLNFNSQIYSAADYAHVMLKISEYSRVILYAGHSEPLQALMTAAAKLNMTNGEYVFIASLPFRHALFGTFQWKSPNQSSDNPFKCLLVIEPTPVPATEELTEMEHHWKQMSKEKYNLTYGQDEKLNPYTASAYNGMMVLAQVAEELRQSGSNLTNFSGRKVAAAFNNRTFHLKTGKLTFNADGEKIPDMSLTQTDPISGEIKGVMELEASTGLLVTTGTLKWPAEWPVPNEPYCGYRGDSIRCQIIVNSSAKYGVALGSTSALVIVCGMLFFSLRSRAVFHCLRTDYESWWRLELEYYRPKKTVICYRSYADIRFT
ncbi:hypothetical protein BV898_19542 [Hypsibius exemplaris]|uniref:Receptor ligand binding region domain-containing protein n=1 Tax=Hypsibius exemplaris TaxID=2072580 RepID=A0A9X6NJ50_HYPEX|nr:hypothetical protein BV898_19542 [Hypsibius exemplaris]